MRLKTISSNRADFPFVVLGDYGSGYEIIGYEETRDDARETLRDYRQNTPEYGFRIGRTKDWE